MNGLLTSLLSSGPLELDRVAAAWGGSIPMLSRLRRTQARDRSLLQATQSLMDVLRADPPPAGGRGA